MKKHGIERIKTGNAATLILNHDTLKATLDYAEGFVLPRGEKKAFIEAYRKRKAEGIIGLKPKVTGWMDMALHFYFMDRKNGMSREAALQKHVPA